MDPTHLYEMFAKIGLNYGSSLQSLSEIGYADSQNAIAKLNNASWVSTPGNAPSFDVLRPSALDNIFQLALVAISRGAKDLIPTMVPQKINRLTITSTTGTIREKLKAGLSLYSQARKTGRRGVEADFGAFMDQSAAVHVHGMISFTAVADLQAPTCQATDGRCYSIDWKPDLGLMSQAQLRAHCYPRFSDTMVQEICSFVTFSNDIKIQAFRHATHIIQSGQKYDDEHSHLENYLKFMQRKLSGRPPTPSPTESLASYIDSALQRTPTVSAEISELTSSELEITVRVARNLNAILQGEIDALQLLFSDDLLTRYYTATTRIPGQLEGFETYIDLLGHKRPSLRILEIGAGTGGTTQTLLDVLSRNGDTHGAGPRFSSYCYTDISPSFFSTAKTRFRDFSDLIEYRVLGIEKDPLSQGFAAEDFDLILAANVVHATSGITGTLTNIEKLLKPEGKLVLFESTQPDALATGFLFGLLPGWWLGSEANRQLSPLLSRDDWQVELKKTGFNDIDLAIEHDGALSRYLFNIMIASKAGARTIVSANEVPVTILASPSSPLQGQLSEEIRLQSPGTILTSVDPEDSSWTAAKGSICIFLLEIEQNHTRDVFGKSFTKVRNMLANAATVLWVTGLHGSIDDSLSGVSKGLSRVCSTERTGLHIVHLILQTGFDISGAATQISGSIANILEQPSTVLDEDFLQIDDMLHIGRIVPDAELERIITPNTSDTVTVLKPLRGDDTVERTMTIGTPGLLDTLRFEQDLQVLLPLPDDYIDVEVQAAGLNFFDVLTAVGELDQTFLGLECAGIVRRKGTAVAGFGVGDRVALLTKGAFKSIARCRASAAIKIPEILDTTTAAGLLLASTTAYYALIHCARIRPGETVLIHSGAGGLGQAAIQIAQSRSAIVYTTVGTTEKKAFLVKEYGIPPENIFSSRTLAFEPALKRLTHGKGVEVILNSLSGQALQTSWRCLAPFGRFLETGKRDISRSTPLPMDGFLKNTSFTSIDLASMSDEQPVLLGELIHEVMNLVQSNKVKVPTPLHTFDVADIENAFRLMQSGKSMGKIVINFANTSMVPTVPPRIKKELFHPNASYIIVGGLGGIGQSICRWLVERGVRNLIILSRRSTYSDEIQEILDEFRSQRVHVATPPCDISSLSSLQSALEQCKGMPAIKGCLQLSMVINHGEFHELTPEALEGSLKPKVDGARNLHEILPADIDFFIMFSSISGLTGTFGMSAYCMGNVYQDELARYRTSQGLKAISVDLGVVFETGWMISNNLESRMRRVGTFGVTPKDIHAFLEHYCDPRLPVQPPARSQVILGLESFAHTRARGSDGGLHFQRPLFACMNRLRVEGLKDSTGTGVAKVDFAAQLQTCTDRQDAIQLVVQGLTEKLGAMLGIVPEEFDLSQPMHTYGIDFLVAIEIRNWFLRFVGAETPVFEILGDTAIRSLVENAIGKKKLSESPEKQVGRSNSLVLSE